MPFGPVTNILLAQKKNFRTSFQALLTSALILIYIYDNGRNVVKKNKENRMEYYNVYKINIFMGAGR